MTHPRSIIVSVVVMLFVVATLMGVPSVAGAQSVAVKTGTHQVKVPYVAGGVEYPFVVYDKSGNLHWPKVERVGPDLKFTFESDEKYWLTHKPLVHDGASKKAVDDLTTLLNKLNRPRVDDGCLKLDAYFVLARSHSLHGIPLMSMRPVETDVGEGRTLVEYDLWYEARDDRPFVVYDPTQPTQPFTSKVVDDGEGGLRHFYESKKRFDFYGGSISQEQWERLYRPAPKGTKSSSP